MLTSTLELTQVTAGISHAMLLTCNKHHIDFFTAKESNCENKVHTVKTRYMLLDQTSVKYTITEHHFNQHALVTTN